MTSSEVEERRLGGIPFFSPALPSLLPWDELDCCLEYTTGGGLPPGSFPSLGDADDAVVVVVVSIAAAEVARGVAVEDLGELLPLLFPFLLLDFGVDSREDGCPARCTQMHIIVTLHQYNAFYLEVASSMT